MSELKTLKEQYLEIQDKNMADLYTKILSSTLDLDDIAKQELQDVFIKESLGAECFANTINLMLDEEEVIQYLKLFLKQNEIVNEIRELVSLEDIESRTEEIIQGFMEDKSEQLNKIYLDSLDRLNQ